LKSKWINLSIGFLVVTFFLGVPERVLAAQNGEKRYALLVGGVGTGFCAVQQQGSQVWASVSVLDFTPTSAGTAWLKFFDASGELITLSRLDGRVADASGQAVFEGHFHTNGRVSTFSFDVRDHERDIGGIADDSDLTTELSQPSNAVSGVSTKMGTCSFENAR
jgi:hypothetical protein